nr:hypothetical protein [Tanacetum cinerariifolium]
YGFTLHMEQKPKGSTGVLKKIDRIMGNLKFNDDFLGLFVVFWPYRISNHSPCLIQIHALDEVQKSLDRNIDCPVLRKEKAYYIQAFNNALLDEERFLKSEIITDSNGVRFGGNDILGIFVIHFETFLGAEGLDICLAVPDFFSNGKLLKELNHIILALIPKVTDYRHISYCNVLYECISKIIIIRIKEGIGDVVDMNQYAFVWGCIISDNILRAQELMCNYHRPSGPPRCAFKIDIVDLYFLKGILIRFSFHPKMISWIMACVTNPSYSICMNGNLFGMFKGKRGLRQGDHMSHYLFTLVMEVLTLLLQQKALAGFQYHHRCDKHKVINLYSGNDLFIFAHGIVESANVIWDALEEFKHFFWFDGTLHVKYLGVPLKSSRLLYRDCKVLTERLQSRVVDWRNKSLSLTKRLQLIMFVLSSMHVYLASIFILPAHIILDLEQSIRPLTWHKISNDVVEILIPSSKGRSTRSSISRIVLVATCYFMWQERNARLFKKSKSHILIYEAIVAIVRLKLISFRFKKTNTHVREMLATWKLPSSFMVYDNSAYGLQSN